MFESNNNNMFKKIIEQSVDAIVVANKDGCIVLWNKSAETLFGYIEEEVLGRYVHDFLPTDNLKEKADVSFQKFKETGHSSITGNFIKGTALAKNGNVINVQFSLSPITSNSGKLICAFIRDITDIIDLLNTKTKLESQASTDELTGILNRRAFMQHSETAFRTAVRHKEPFSFLMLDLDNFKEINDQYGHHAGDFSLEKFTETISNIIRIEDIFGRIGGEEFCITMAKTDKEIAFKTAERIRKAVDAMQISFARIKFKITVSIGLATAEKKDKSLDSIAKRADKTLYKAKASGRNRVCLG